MNDFERDVYDRLTAKGAIVLRNGWPDFLVLGTKGNRHYGYGLELKRGDDGLRPSQEVMHAALGLFGVQVHTVRPPDIWRLFCRPKCGTITGYNTHRRKGEEVCPDCMAGMRAYKQHRRALVAEPWVS